MRLASFYVAAALTTLGPVEGLADIKGIKMRTPPSPMMSKTWEALGTLPVSVA